MGAILSYFDLVGFGAGGWGAALLKASAMTLAVSVSGFLTGAVVGALVSWGKLSGGVVLRSLAGAYTTVMRGVPDLLVVYLFYFGGSAALGSIAALFGADGFVGMPTFITGTLALGVVSGAYQAEVIRGAFLTVSRGEIEAAKAAGMLRWTMFRRIVAPLVLRFALPGLGNTWQLVLKESALISVTGLVEILRQSQIAAGSTWRPFDFYMTAALLYLAITWASTLMFRRAETSTMTGFQRAL